MRFVGFAHRKLDLSYDARCRVFSIWQVRDLGCESPMRASVSCRFNSDIISVENLPFRVFEPPPDHRLAYYRKFVDMICALNKQHQFSLETQLAPRAEAKPSIFEGAAPLPAAALLELGWHAASEAGVTVSWVSDRT